MDDGNDLEFIMIDDQYNENLVWNYEELDEPLTPLVNMHNREDHCFCYGVAEINTALNYIGVSNGLSCDFFKGLLANSNLYGYLQVNENGCFTGASWKNVMLEMDNCHGIILKMSLDDRKLGRCTKYTLQIIWHSLWGIITT